MAKKIKFPLKLNSADCRTLNEVRENWNINEVYVYFVDGRLLTWCKDRHYIQADKIAEISIEDSDARKKLCEIFDVEYVAGDSDSDDWRPKTPEEVEKYNRLTNYTADKEILKKFRQVAFDRDELDDLIDDYGEIYLCNNTFEEFPINVENKKYIGIGKVTVKIPNKEIVDFYEKNITFKNINVNDVDDGYKNIVSESLPDKWFHIADEAEKNKDYAKAIEYYSKAVEQNHIKAMDHLAGMYFDGLGVEKNPDKGLELLKKGAELGDADMMFTVGAMYLEGIGIQQDDQKAVEWFQKAVDKGNETAMGNLALLYLDGKGVKKDEVKAFNLFQKVAESGKPDAMYFMGMMYLHGEGTQQVVYKGINLLEKAAELGNAAAMMELGEIYRNGDFEVTADATVAFKWYMKAAEAGNAEAMNTVGFMYDNSEGVAQNENQAMEWYKKAADLGDTIAMLNLAYNYEFAKNDRDTAKKYLKKAVDLGEKRALKYLGDLYRKSGDYSDSQADYQTAWRYYTQSANEGNVDAMYNLGVMYDEGHGVAKNEENKNYVIEWLKKAEANGHPHAKELREKIEKGGCFITAAVCDSFNKPDECFELTTFRNFRDDWLALQSDGKILIEEYYKIAPQIVANINKLINANEIYKKLWYDWLAPCLEFIKVGDNVACKNKYVEMVQNLKKLYL